MRKVYGLIFCLILYYPSLILAANPVEGQRIYDHNCAMCHGMQGVSVMASAPNFNRGEGLLKSDFTLSKHINNGKNACPAFIGILREQQIFDVIAYLRTFYQ